VTARATVFIPAAGAGGMAEGGGPASAAVDFVLQEGGDTVRSVGSGAYCFEVSGPLLGAAGGGGGGGWDAEVA
jgi:hypothetical protein